jgi:hypothetical protein
VLNCNADGTRRTKGARQVARPRHFVRRSTRPDTRAEQIANATIRTGWRCEEIASTPIAVVQDRRSRGRT